MRQRVARTSLRVGLALLLAALLIGVAVGVYSQVTAFSYADLKAALRARGATVRESGTLISSVTFQGTGHQLSVNGAQVAVYEYGTTIAAQVDAARVSSDGATFRGGFWPFGGRAATVDWIAPPHHYKKGRVIVTSVGEDGAIMRLLTSVLGPQFAGGTVPGSTGYLWLVERLQAVGATVAVIRHIPTAAVIWGTQPTTDGYEIRVNGAIIDAFAFTTEHAAATYASHIAGGDYVDPAYHQYIIVDYAAPPHFFRQGSLIVLYVGEDAQIMRMLTGVLGPAFAEGNA